MKYINSTSHYGDIETLRMFSPVARKNAGNKFFILEFEVTEGDFGPYDIFHPKDTTGVIQLMDECMFGLRCDHLVYIDGYSCIYGISDEIGQDEFNNFIEEHQKDKLDSILLLANHKGNLVLRLIIFETNN